MLGLDLEEHGLVGYADFKMNTGNLQVNTKKLEAL
jgi:hypothetical protein